MGTRHSDVRVALLLAMCVASGSGQGLPQQPRPAFPSLPSTGPLSRLFQALAPGEASAAGMAPSSEEVQYPALAPAPLGTGQPYRPASAPRPAPGPLSPYNPIFNPIISVTTPNTQASTSMQTQGLVQPYGSNQASSQTQAAGLSQPYAGQTHTQYQTVTANSNGQVTTTPTTYPSTSSSSNSGSSNSGSSNSESSNSGSNNSQYSSNTQQNSPTVSSTYGQGGSGNSNTQQTGGYGTQNGQTSQTGSEYQPAPAPAPLAIGETNSMVHAVDLAHQKAQTTPQLSFGQDGVTVQQPVVNNADGITSGGNQFKVNEHGVILGNVGTGGSVDFANDGGVTIDPGTAGNLWNLARSAAQLYGRKLQERTE
ncbi:hypothetical protein CVIRNUC_006640 [Coccomyxa viridis]|uniref:Uncharacterized protein n=1 Tax=Coccomyxa viridis TaxID=1274662 RepID=A0AAV1I9Q0_9CHLO|nr:hypothetical protein CVIRNUC_006640 [Coccomyxa viridis]